MWDKIFRVRVLYSHYATWKEKRTESMAQWSHVPRRFLPLTTDRSPNAVTSVCYFQYIHICSVNRVNYNFSQGGSGGTFSIGAVIVLNGWWPRPAWFCSSCLQLERLPTMSAMRRHHCTDLSLSLEPANADLHCYHEWCSITAQLPPICYKHYIAVLAWNFLSTQLQVFQFLLFSQ